MSITKLSDVTAGNTTKATDHNAIVTQTNKILPGIGAIADDYAILDDDDFTHIMATTGGTALTVTLPTAADNDNRIIEILKADSGAGIVTLDGEGAETINGGTDETLVTQYNRLKVISNGTTWFILERFQSYETAYINRSDWTNVHIGTNAAKDTDSNVTHNLDTALSNLIVKLLVSTDGADANSFEFVTVNVAASAGNRYGVTIYGVNNDNVLIQTGTHGIQSVLSDGTVGAVDTDDWYYKIVVQRR